MVLLCKLIIDVKSGIMNCLLKLIDFPLNKIKVFLLAEYIIITIIKEIPFNIIHFHYLTEQRRIETHCFYLVRLAIKHFIGLAWNSKCFLKLLFVQLRIIKLIQELFIILIIPYLRGIEQLFIILQFSELVHYFLSVFALFLTTKVKFLCVQLHDRVAFLKLRNYLWNWTH